MSAAHTSSTGSNNLGSSIEQRVHIYIDNSNIYIQGAKTYLPGSNQNPVSDLSWRYDVSSLREVLYNNSGLQLNPTVQIPVYTTLYGSVPPPGDIWEAINRQLVTVHRFERSPMTGREKQVDTKMGVDITERAILDRVERVQSEFIVVTGDGDLLPAVEMINKMGFRAHVWSWRNSFSSAFQENSDENKRQFINLHYLDDFKHEFEYHKPDLSATPCKWSKYCKDNVKCRYLHSQDHQAYFAKYRGPKQLRRYKPCKNGEDCNCKNTCFYYHNETERICPTCDQAGKGHGEVGSLEWQNAHVSS